MSRAARLAVLGLALVLPRLAAAADVCSPAILDLRESGAELRFNVEIADDATERAQGLMFRESMAKFSGMLFVYETPQPVAFWMKNTLIPLSIAFIDADGKIVNIADMQPQTEANHCAARPVRYALEMNLGWFASKGMAAGTRIGGIEKAPAPR